MMCVGNSEIVDIAVINRICCAPKLHTYLQYCTYLTVPTCSELCPTALRDTERVGFAWEMASVDVLLVEK